MREGDPRREKKKPPLRRPYLLMLDKPSILLCQIADFIGSSGTRTLPICDFPGARHETSRDVRLRFKDTCHMQTFDVSIDKARVITEEKLLSCSLGAVIRLALQQFSCRRFRLRSLSQKAQRSCKG